jgi:hypothetical protein
MEQESDASAKIVATHEICNDRPTFHPRRPSIHDVGTTTDEMLAEMGEWPACLDANDFCLEYYFHTKMGVSQLGTPAGFYVNSLTVQQLAKLTARVSSSLTTRGRLWPRASRISSRHTIKKYQIEKSRRR